MGEHPAERPGGRRGKRTPASSTPCRSPALPALLPRRTPCAHLRLVRRGAVMRSRTARPASSSSLSSRLWVSDAQSLRWPAMRPPASTRRVRRGRLALMASSSPRSKPPLSSSRLSSWLQAQAGAGRREVREAGLLGGREGDGRGAAPGTATRRRHHRQPTQQHVPRGPGPPRGSTTLPACPRLSLAQTTAAALTSAWAAGGRGRRRRRGRLGR